MCAKLVKPRFYRPSTGCDVPGVPCPGSKLKVEFDNTNPIAYGMPSHGLARFLNSTAFEVTA